MLAEGGRETALIAAAEVPLTLGGAALYNIENALAAALAARALGLPDVAIAGALADFRSDTEQNPGRANEFAVHGARVFVDFAHNPHSIAAVTRALAAIPARRRLVLLMHAGDRSDAEITALVDGAFALAPAVVVVAENPAYLRGRPPGEIPALMGRASLAHGLAEGGLVFADTPLAGAAALLDRLRPGDLALLLAHADRQAIFDLIRTRQAGS
jgi:UDP-N-acetylmuramyl tripeptide synthase